eukprot:CCRYP_009586-RA/>CCRYP_009586-RA protein AED:0.00 eAED:0.00 QI:224/1/0.5/1/0/0/2/0/83
MFVIELLDGIFDSGHIGQCHFVEMSWTAYHLPMWNRTSDFCVVPHGCVICGNDGCSHCRRNERKKPSTLDACKQTSARFLYAA